MIRWILFCLPFILWANVIEEIVQEIENSGSFPKEQMPLGTDEFSKCYALSFTRFSAREGMIRLEDADEKAWHDAQGSSPYEILLKKSMAKLIIRLEEVKKSEEMDWGSFYSNVYQTLKQVPGACQVEDELVEDEPEHSEDEADSEGSVLSEEETAETPSQLDDDGKEIETFHCLAQILHGVLSSMNTALENAQSLYFQQRTCGKIQIITGHSKGKENGSRQSMGAMMAMSAGGSMVMGGASNSAQGGAPQGGQGGMMGGSMNPLMMGMAMGGGGPGGFGCTSFGEETQDWKSCIRAITLLEGMMLAEQGMKTYQQVKQSESQTKAQTKMIENMQVEAQDMALTVEVMQDQIKEQAERSGVKAGFSGAKMAALVLAYKNFPKTSKLVERCENAFALHPNYGEKAYSWFINKIAFRKNDALTEWKNFAEKTLEDLEIVNLVGLQEDMTVDAEDFEHPTLDIKKYFQGTQIEAFQQVSEKFTELSDFKPGYSDASDMGAGCAKTFAEHGQNYLMNAQFLPMLQQFIAMSGIETAQFAAETALLSDQAKSLDDTISALKQGTIESIDAPDLPNDLTLKECQLNPNLPKCRINNIAVDRGFRGRGDLNFSAGTNALLSQKTAAAIDTSAPSKKAAGSADSSKIDSTISDGMAQTHARGRGGFEAYPKPAARVKTKPRTGGGGGGGGAGGASAPTVSNNQGGGGAKAPGPAKQTTFTYGGRRGGGQKGSNVAYGGGRRDAKRVAAKNPFDSMFGKKKNKNKSGVIKFRDPASKHRYGSRGESLFKRISRRYARVNKQKRLLEYEQIP